MGNCVTCNNTPASSSPSLEPTAPVITVNPDMKCQESRDSSIPAKRSHMHRHSLTTFDHQVNGNSKTNVLSVETGGSLHRDKSLRILCNRIQQPLTRVGSGRSNEQTKQAKLDQEVIRVEKQDKDGAIDAKTNALFDLYRDAEHHDLILADGMDRLLNDLHLAPEELKVLVLAWRLDASCMCQFTRDEFVTGLRKLRADSLSQLTLRLSELTEEVISDPELFKDLYRFTFRFGLDRSSGQRILPIDVAVCLWRIVFSLRLCPILDSWIAYLECHPINGIPKDTWDMFLHLTDAIGADLTNYDDSHAWPSVFDDFVEYEIDRVNQNVTAKDRQEGLVQQEGF